MHICTHMHTSRTMHKYYGYSSSMCVSMHIYAYSPTRVDRARDGQKVIQRRSADGRAKGSIDPSYFIPADTLRGACIRGGYQITRLE